MRFLNISTRLKRYMGFTLAEVLIALGIIGVVAVLTIPSIIQNSKNKAEVTRLEKFYTIFSQAMRTYAINQGCNDMQCTGMFNGQIGDNTWESNIDTAIKSAFKIVKSCSTNAIGCDTGFYKPLKYLDKTPAPATFNINKLLATGSFSGGHSFMTADGSMFMIYDTDTGNCNMHSGKSHNGQKLKNSCAYAYVDVNGPKEPNTFGQDIYMYEIGNDGVLYPVGGADFSIVGEGYWQRSLRLCGVSGSSMVYKGITGAGCSARIMEEDWEMNYNSSYISATPPGGGS